MSINWYPGHMVKARRDIEASLKLVDIVIMLLDARAPLSCRNPDLEHLARHKKIVMVLNKNDLADPAATRSFLKHLRQEGLLAVAMDSLKGRGTKQVLDTIHQAFEKQRQDMLSRGRRVRPVRLMITGVPNVGKSTFLNSLVGQKMARTGARPGVTRGKQWIRVREDMEIMDTPGLLWPKIESEEQGLKLALLNIVGENAYEEYEVALYLLTVLRKQAPQLFTEYYKVKQVAADDQELLSDIARQRGHLVKGGQPDPEKTARQIISDFRSGNLGRLTLDQLP